MPIIAAVKKVARRGLLASGLGRAYVFERDTRMLLKAYAQRGQSPLAWEALPPAPIERYDASGAQLGALLYVIGGYVHLDRISPVVDTLDLRTGRWTRVADMPPAMAHHHHGTATDGVRFVYCVSGQFGPRCSPSVPTAYVFDASTRRWSELPPLPEPRYAPAMQLWRGRLHVLGGAKTDRVTPAADHWSLPVQDGRALASAWTPERPIPRGGGHRTSAVVDDRLYLLGGQEGDFKAIPGDPLYNCTHETREVVYPDCFVLEPGAVQWERLPDMPVGVGHVESSTAIVGKRVVIVGGGAFKDPVTYRMELTDVVQQFDTTTRTWSTLGRTPYRVKTCVVGYHDRWLYATSGQRDTDDDNPMPGGIERRAWRTRLPL